MIRNNFKCFVLSVFYLLILTQKSNCSIMDYISSVKNTLFGGNESSDSKDLTLGNVAYEIDVPDEEFIQHAVQLAGVPYSKLDACQYSVVHRLQTKCHEMTDEEMSKLAVNLLNCQSQIEGRTIYPCTEEMPLRECTEKMDPDTWNSYLLMSNRARAACYLLRQTLFRGLAEMTVNKLMDKSKEQIDILERLKAGQRKIEESTQNTLENVVKGHDILKEQQDDLRKAQFHGQLTIENNIRRLADEKQLIIEGHEKLIEMTQGVENKLVEASKQLNSQEKERKNNQKEILNDLVEIQKQAKLIFEQLDKSSRHMLEQSTLAAKQYELTLAQLSEMNSTVYSLVDIVINTRLVMEEKMKWLSEALGGTDDLVERLYIIISHVAYLILFMIACAFLQVPIPGRVALIVLVPINLLFTLQGNENSLSLLHLTAILSTFFTVQALYYFIMSLRNKNVQIEAIKNEGNNTTPNNSNRQEEINDVRNYLNSTKFSLYSHRNGNASSTNLDHSDSNSSQETHADDGHANYENLTPPLSRQGRSRSTTPNSIGNGFLRRRCTATTRMGTPCKTMALLGRDYCHRHQTVYQQQ